MIIVDWQTIRKGFPGIDVAELLGGSISIEMRQKHEKDLCQLYYDEFIYAANLTKEEYPFEYILNTIQIFLPYTLRRAMVIGPNGRNYNPDTFTQRQYDLFANMTRRGLQAMADWNTMDGLKEHLERGRPPTVEEVRRCIPKHLWKTVAL